MECPICFDQTIIYPLMCHHKHQVCLTCATNLDSCPMCRYEFYHEPIELQIRNYLEQNLGNRIQFGIINWLITDPEFYGILHSFSDVGDGAFHLKVQINYNTANQLDEEFYSYLDEFPDDEPERDRINQFSNDLYANPSSNGFLLDFPIEGEYVIYPVDLPLIEGTEYL